MTGAADVFVDDPDEGAGAGGGGGGAGGPPVATAGIPEVSR